jgi:hypothetical protein
LNENNALFINKGKPCDFSEIKQRIVSAKGDLLPFPFCFFFSSQFLILLLSIQTKKQQYQFLVVVNIKTAIYWRRSSNLLLASITYTILKTEKAYNSQFFYILPTECGSIGFVHIPCYQTISLHANKSAAIQFIH